MVARRAIDAEGSGAVPVRLISSAAPTDPRARPRASGMRPVIALATAIALLAAATLTFLVSSPASASNGDITTVAGNGSAGPAVADGAQATSGAFDQPDGVTFDANQNMIVVEYGAGRVRKVTPGGVVSTLASSGLTTPTDVLVDPNGAVIVADYGGHRVRKISGGTMTVIAGNGVAGYGGDGGPATAAKLDYPAGVALDSAGNLYIADSGNNRIRKVDTNGNITTFAGKGMSGFGGDGRKANEAVFNDPTGVTFDTAGNLYIADTSNNRIRKIDTVLNVSTIAGTGTYGHTGDGGSATAATLGLPVGVTFDSTGTLFVGEYGTDVVRAIATDSTISTVAGTGTAGYSGDGGPATSAMLHDPVRVALDAAGNLYVGDKGNNRVRRLERNTPAAPTITARTPASPSPSTSVTVKGTAPAGVTVSVYTDGSCTGTAAATGSAATFASAGITVTVAPDTTTTLSASDQGTGNRSGCSNAVTYTNDTIAPVAPTITSAPPAQGTGHSPYWTFTTEAASTTSCWLTDGATVVSPEAPCTNSAAFNVSTAAIYTFHVHATDAAGNVGPEAQGSYELVTTGPQIVASPASPGVVRSVSWTFTSVDSAPMCRLTLGATVVSADAACTSSVPVTYDLTNQPDGAYTFTVTETGGGSGVANTDNYVLDTTAPSIDTAPPSVSASTTPAWTFSGGTGTRTICALSGPAPTVTRDPCSSGSFDLSGHPDGSYTFSVWSATGTDVSATATSPYELLTTTPPAASVSGSPSPGSDSRPTWTFAVPSAMTASCSLAQGATVIQPMSDCSGTETYDLTDDADATYTFSVALTNAAGTSGPTTSSDYVLDRVAPDAPAITDSPATPANARFVSWSFTAEPGASTSCTLSGGTLTGVPASCSGAEGYDLTGQPDGSYTFSVTATDAAGNQGQPATSTYVLDTSLPPAPVFTVLPIDPGRSRSASWSFTAPGAASTTCTLSTNGTAIAGPTPCAGSYTADLTGRPDGGYVLSVVAVSTAGNASPPATSSYTLDTTPPAVPGFTQLPVDPGRARAVAWGFAAPGSVATTCTLMSGATVVVAAATCSSPYTVDLSGQPDGVYTASVVAADAAGNRSAPATNSYTLDTTAPAAPAFTRLPIASGRARSAKWTFTAAGSASTLCTLARDGVTLDGPAPCGPDYTADLTSQADGIYSLSVVALDAAGNASDPAVGSYLLDTTPPTAPVVVTAPPTSGSGTDPSWTFSLEPGSTATCTLSEGDTVVSPPTSCASPVTYDLAGRDPGAYTLTVVATDSAGNTGPAAVLGYTLVKAESQPAPTTTTTVPPTTTTVPPTTTTTTTSTTSTTVPAPAETPVAVVSTTSSTTSTTVAPPPPSPVPAAPSPLAQLAAVAKTVGEKTAFPSALAVLVVIFLAVQDRIDRSDPKLALAPVHAEPDLGFDPPSPPGALQ